MRWTPDTSRSVRARIAMATALWLGLSLGAAVSLRQAGAEAPSPAWQAGGGSGVPRGANSMIGGEAALAPFGAERATVASVIERLRFEQRRSVQRALAVLDARFDEWRDRSGAFAEELLRWSTRGRLAWRSVGDAIDGGAARLELVRSRFEALVVSEAELRAAIAQAFDRLALELRADRARALSRVRARVTAPPGTGSADVIVADIAGLDERMDHVLVRHADRSLMAGVAGFAGAVVVTEVVAGAVGSALAGAAAGAAGGSFVPVAGTIAGFAAGLAAGIAVDWWASDVTRRDLESRCRGAVDELRRRVIDGEPPGSGARRGARPATGGGRPGDVDRGLRALFDEAAERQASMLESHLSAMEARTR